ncbi:CopG family transcriptional regulator [Aureimonas endophytica]|uniref:CopG family transcriptional regulator n=1 Tax=Aureimonas endophytica TaxID=2027858 RepID=A0A916ZVQ5_9HYPH|nr:type II toxin-antitoxin system ParD family antitoxin [Aureimonas endophytica]GGE16240.1 CopG family transcriptional regulator [Aureimonas endophytica]
MGSTRVLQIELPTRIADLVQEKVAAGEYASESEVIAERLEDLLMEDAAIERWLKEDVVPTYDAMMRDPGRGLSLAEARRQIEAHIAKKNEAAGDA